MKNKRPLLILACFSLTFSATQQSKDTSLLEKIINIEKGVCFRFYMSVLTGWFHKKWNCIWYKVVSNFHKKKWISGRSRNIPQRINLRVRIVERFQHIKASSFLLATWEWYTPDRYPNMIENPSNWLCRLIVPLFLAHKKNEKWERGKQRPPFSTFSWLGLRSSMKLP